MKHFVLSLDENGKLQCTVERGKLGNFDNVLPDMIVRRSVKGDELERFLSRIDTSKYIFFERDRKIGKHSLSKADARLIDQEDKSSMIYIKDFERTLPAIEALRERISTTPTPTTVSGKLPPAKKGAIAIGAIVMAIMLTKCGIEIKEAIINSANGKGDDYGEAIEIKGEPIQTETLIQDIVDEKLKADAALLPEQKIEDNTKIEHEEDILTGPGPDPDKEEKLDNLVASYKSDIEVIDNIQGVYDQGIQDSLKQYKDEIKLYANRYGVSESIIDNIIAQESSGGSVDNIGQIEWKWYRDREITLFNYEKNDYEKVVFTTDLQRYKNRDDVTVYKITDQCVAIIPVIIQENFGMFNNILYSIATYNNGSDNISKFIRKVCEETGYTREQLLSLPDKETLALFDKYGIKDVKGKTYLYQVIKHLNENEKDDGVKREYQIIHNGVAHSTQLEIKPANVQQMQEPNPTPTAWPAIQASTESNDQIMLVSDGGKSR